MTKPQTFEEWLIGYFKDIEALDLVIASRMQDSYAAGMENAARICEEPLDTVRLRIGEFPRQSAIDIRAALDDRAETRNRLLDEAPLTLIERGLWRWDSARTTDASTKQPTTQERHHV